MNEFTNPGKNHQAPQNTGEWTDNADLLYEQGLINAKEAGLRSGVEAVRPETSAHAHSANRGRTHHELAVADERPDLKPEPEDLTGIAELGLAGVRKRNAELAARKRGAA